MSRGVYVRGVSVQEGICPGVSVRGVHVRGGFVLSTSIGLESNSVCQTSIGLSL